MIHTLSVREEVSLLLHKVRRFKKGTTPYVALTKLYVRYVKEEKAKDSLKRTSEIDFEFARFCNKNVGWVLNFCHPCSKIDPSLLESLEITDSDGITFSITLAKIIYIHPHETQRKIWEEAKKNAQGKQELLFRFVSRISRYASRNNSELPSSLLSVVYPAKKNPIPLPSSAPTPSSTSSQTIPKIVTQERKSSSDERFLELLAKQSTTPPTRSQDSGHPIKQPLEWKGASTIYKDGERTEKNP